PWARGHRDDQVEARPLRAAGRAADRPERQPHARGARRGTRNTRGGRQPPEGRARAPRSRDHLLGPAGEPLLARAPRSRGVVRACRVLAATAPSRSSPPPPLGGGWEFSRAQTRILCRERGKSVPTLALVDALLRGDEALPDDRFDRIRGARD